MIREDELKRTCKHIIFENSLSVYEFKPSFLHLLAVPIEPLSIARRFRFLLEFIRGGYTVYYLVKDGVVVGYCVVTPGGRRLKCSSKQDGVIGPLYICQEYRGRSLSEVIVKQSLICCLHKYNSFYCWIHKDNIPSRRSLESCGFKPIGRLNVVGVFRRLVITSQGVDIIYKRSDNCIPIQ